MCPVGRKMLRFDDLGSENKLNIQITITNNQTHFIIRNLLTKVARIAKNQKMKKMFT